MNHRKTRGFTLIELLVAIAIIGIMAAIVIVFLSSARTKSNDSKVKSQLVGLRTAAENYYGSNNNYGATVDGTGAAGTSIGLGCASGMFASTELAKFTLASNYPASAAGAGKCTSSGEAYAVSVKLDTANTYWCVDNRGTGKQTGALQSSDTYICP